MEFVFLPVDFILRKDLGFVSHAPVDIAAADARSNPQDSKR